MLRSRKRRLVLISVFALISLFLVCAVAFASGGAEHGAAHENGKMLDLLYRCINFTLLIIILVVVIKKSGITTFFGNRIEEIKNKFDDLKAKKDETEKRYREIEEKLRDFEAKKQDIIEQFKSEGIAEKERIIAEGKDRAKQILAQADLTIEREIHGAKARLMQEVANVAARKAEEIIGKVIKDSDQNHLVDEFIERVEKLN